MSFSNNSPVPDLASVLKTLASVASQNYQQPAQVIPQYDQPANISGYQQPQQPLPPTLEAFLPKSGQSSSTPESSQNPKKLVDPATIVEWSAGLRCVMKTVTKHEHILHEVRRMIKVQHEHEEQWWNGRQALIAKQKAREEGQKKLDEVLAVGGSASTAASNTNPEEMARELETFDMKVWKAQMQMVREMNAKLRSLGIPFFGTRSDLVRPAGKEAGDAKESKAVIDEVELVKLQRRMLEMLEDLCNE